MLNFDSKGRARVTVCLTLTVRALELLQDMKDVTQKKEMKNMTRK
jgi:hypothetical protein